MKKLANNSESITIIVKYLSLFLTFLRLGCTSFGGPVAHLGYFREEFVVRKQWVSDTEYANLIGLCQFIPGPASSQVGAALGFVRAGYTGAFLAWLGFTLPSAILMFFAAMSLFSNHTNEWLDWLQGLKLVAVAIVAHAVWGMQKQLCNTIQTRFIALIAVIILMTVQTPLIQLFVVVGGLFLGFLMVKDSQSPVTLQPSQKITSNVIPVLFLCLFTLGLFGVPMIANQTDTTWVLFDKFYRAGALVFGGGHVVLPLLFTEFVAAGLVSEDNFLIGYGAAQALPGPLFAFSTFIGAAVETERAVSTAIMATIAIFLPGMLLLFATLPYWATISQHATARRCLVGVNAAVVGLLFAALLNPIITTTISTYADILIATTALILLIKFKLHPLWIIAGCLVSNGVVILLFA